ncbi:hypothetical protein QBC43DRAFT_290030 [Cladorrhinum sp. PSN259]|nr:hypothetical protein QBC43DRAFT_290030 [Cladorrhinum sp. PSN259]
MRNPNDDFPAIGASSTFERRPQTNRVSRRSQSHSQRSEIDYTPQSNSVDMMEQGFAQLRHPGMQQPSGKEKQTQQQPEDRRSTVVLEPLKRMWQATLAAVLFAIRIATGQNTAVANCVMFWASVLGLLLAVAGIFGYPTLPLLRRIGGRGNSSDRVTPTFGNGGGGLFGGGMWEGHTTVNNFYYCTFARDGTESPTGAVAGGRYRAMLRNDDNRDVGRNGDGDGGDGGFIRVDVEEDDLGEVVW